MAIKRKWECCGCGNTVRKELEQFPAMQYDVISRAWIACKSTYECVKRQDARLDVALSEYHNDVVKKVNELSDSLAGDAGWSHIDVRHALVELIDTVANTTNTVTTMNEGAHPPACFCKKMNNGKKHYHVFT